MRTVPFEALDPALYREIVRRALAEDLGWGDVTTEAVVPLDVRATGTIVARGACVLAGLDVAAETFRQLDPSCAFRPFFADGQACAAGAAVATVEGMAGSLLTAERTALNFLQHLSGIATLTHRFVEECAGRIIVLDTRKTTPTLRALEHYAVRAGGGAKHRGALDDGVLIKANHLAIAGSVGEAVRRMKAAEPEMPIEVEVRSLAQVAEALDAGANTIVAIRLTPDDVREAVRMARGRAQVAAAGDFDLGSVDAFAATGADYLSIGALTQSAPAADLRFDLDRR
ncbi:MAG TPA: carboxylating nicotinate-nucleotide diphosphorylase [Vicinamibacterales bacterium]|jgi:nicotinate-nucleotide pyrophosphorylase (carboxylating)|nr:carboxylating nicotinate-nucleotide diphosphorylase [Vicinamibacterales bacterium]